MKTKGFTRKEIIFTSIGLIILASLLFFAVLDTRRRSRDAGRVSTLRQIEFDLEEYRNVHASFPDAIERLYGGVGIPGYEYTALPIGCRPDGVTLCSSYTISFSLEGPVGSITGGACESSPDGITCVR